MGRDAPLGITQLLCARSYLEDGFSETRIRPGDSLVKVGELLQAGER
jgi:hypothetical protein